MYQLAAGGEKRGTVSLCNKTPYRRGFRDDSCQPTGRPVEIHVPSFTCSVNTRYPSSFSLTLKCALSRTSDANSVVVFRITGGAGFIGFVMLDVTHNSGYGY